MMSLITCPYNMVYWYSLTSTEDYELYEIAFKFIIGLLQ